MATSPQDSGRAKLRRDGHGAQRKLNLILRYLLDAGTGAG
jgi:hypothetical protein